MVLLAMGLQMFRDNSNVGEHFSFPNAKPMKVLNLTEDPGLLETLWNEIEEPFIVEGNGIGSCIESCDIVLCTHRENYHK